MRLFKLFANILVILFALMGCASNSFYKYESKDELEKLKSSIDNSHQKLIAVSKVDNLSKSLNSTYIDPSVKVTRIDNPIRKVFRVLDKKNKIEAYSKIRINPNGDCSLVYWGPINDKDTSIFFEAAKEITKHECNQTLVQLESLGGTLSTGMRMGLLIHKNSWETMAWRENIFENYYISGCHSACSLAFLAGSKRYERKLINAYDRIGPVFFHQMAFTKGGKKECIVDPVDPNNLILYSYLAKIRGENAINLYAKILDTSCIGNNESYFFEDTNKIVYTSEFTSDIIKRFIFD